MNIYGRKFHNTTEAFSRVEEMLPDFITVGKTKVMGTTLTFLNCTYSRYSRKYDRVLKHTVIKCIENTPTHMGTVAIDDMATDIYGEIMRTIGMGATKDVKIY